jgi:hypothetical protein
VSKKTNYSKMANIAKDLITKNGTTITLCIENNNGKSWKPSEDNDIIYTNTGVFIPPVNGIYFQGTRFGQHILTEDDLSAIKLACLVSPLFDENGNDIDLSKVTSIIRDNIKYRVTFCDTLKPADRVLFYAYGIGR